MIEFEGPAIRYEKPYRLTIAVIDPIFSYSKKYNNTMQYNFMDTVYSMLESDVFYYSHKKDILRTIDGTQYVAIDIDKIKSYDGLHVDQILISDYGINMEVNERELNNSVYLDYVVSCKNDPFVGNIYRYLLRYSCVPHDYQIIYMTKEIIKDKMVWIDNVEDRFDRLAKMITEHILPYPQSK